MPKALLPHSETSTMDHHGAPPELAIEVMAALGTGRTPLSAFDDALRRCGVHDFNLIPLSSVIPPCATVVVSERHSLAGACAGHGQKLYVVRAEQRSAIPGRAVGAGVGWFQWADGRGLFVEHEAESDGVSVDEMERSLEQVIRISLKDLAERRGVDIDDQSIRTRVVAGRVRDRPLCALSIAVYESEGWRGIADRRTGGRP